MKKSAILASTAFGKLNDEQILSMFDLSKGVEAKIDEKASLKAWALSKS